MKRQKRKRDNLQEYAKYSALSFQMVAIILLGAFGGVKLDEILTNDFPLFTVTLTILALVFAMYYFIKKVS